MSESVDVREATSVHESTISYDGVEYKFYESEVSPQNRLTFVVPVFREYASGNIHSFIESLSLQTANQNTFEAIFLVNNPPYSDSGENVGYHENQKTLALLRAVQDPSINLLDYSDLDRRVVERARQSGVCLSYVDMSTDGLEEFNVGKIRSLGLDLAGKRSDKTVVGENGIVSNFDADCTLTSNHVEEISKPFEDESVMVVGTGYEYSPEGDINPDVMYRALFFQELYKLDILLRDGSFVWGSPRVFMRHSALKAVGGMPQVEHGEDFLLAKNLVDMFLPQNGVRFLPAVQVDTRFRDISDRPEGFDSADIARNIDLNKYSTDVPIESYWSRFVVSLIRYNMQHMAQDESEILEKIREALIDIIGEGDMDSEDVRYLDGVQWEEIKGLKSLAQTTDWVISNIMEGSGLSQMTTEEFVLLPIGCLFYHTLPGNEYDRFKEIVSEIYELDENRLKMEIPNSTSRESGVSSIDDTHFRRLGLFARAFNYFCEEALSTKTLPEARNLILSSTDDGSLG